MPPRSSAIIQTAICSGTYGACGIAVQAKVGDPICQGDIIESASDGRVGHRFIDGTVLRPSGDARMVLDELVCDFNGTSQFGPVRCHSRDLRFHCRPGG